MFCGKCGSKNREDSRYCINCGSKLDNPRSIGKDKKEVKAVEETIKIKPTSAQISDPPKKEEVVENNITKKDISQSSVKKSTKNNSVLPVVLVIVGVVLVVAVRFLVVPIVKDMVAKDGQKQEDFVDKSKENKEEEKTERERELEKELEKKNKEIEKEKNSDYMMPRSDTSYLTKEELSGYSKQELALIRNEIYARYGYVFESEYYKEYFGDKSWYTPDYNVTNSGSYFNEYEKANVKLIKALEGE